MAVRSLKNSTIENFANYSSSMNAGYSFQDYELIESVFVASPTASVTFNNLNQYAAEYKHLQIRSTVKGSAAFSSGNVRLRFNSDSGNNYAIHKLFGDGSGVAALAGTSRSSTVSGLAYNSGTANAFSAGVCDILDAYSTTKNKTTRALSDSRGDGSSVFIQLISGAWFNTSSIANIALDLEDGGNFVAGSRFSLYGIR